MRTRRFLFLQGNASHFFDRLGRALRDQGHAVHRINFNGGDWAFWSLPGAVSFRGALDAWPDFLQARHNLTTALRARRIQLAAATAQTRNG